MTAYLGAHGGTEGYIPAEHDTHWTSLVSQAQNLADLLASCTNAALAPSSIPFVDQLNLRGALFCQGLLCIHPASALEKLYTSGASPACSLLPLKSSTLRCTDWEYLVVEAKLTNFEISVMMWVRSISFISVCVPGAYCPFCKIAVSI